MNQRFYRFRRINSLIGDFKELENQSIFFASPESLNDPMEGFRDVYWKGDSIVWNNLFKHYLLCLERLCSILLISGEDFPIENKHIPLFDGEDDFPTEQHKESFSSISREFLNNVYISKLIKSISERTTPIRRDELFFYLNTIHPFALEVISSQYETNGFIPKREKKNTNAEQKVKKLIDQNLITNLEEKIKKYNGDEKINSAFFSSERNNHAEIVLIAFHKSLIERNSKNKNFIFIEFPDIYISELEKLVYPEWFTACFMTECKSSSVWGHYGDNHSGACLIFESEFKNGNNFLSLKGPVGYGHDGIICDYESHELRQVNYIEGYGEIDFFRMLGRLPEPKLYSMWYTFDGKTSSCAKDMQLSIDDWRSKYWDDFYRDITIKSKDWSYENEYRIILSNLFGSYSDSKNRTLTYKFESLKGIIFGIKTTTENKLKIIDIIEKKCEELGRSNFKFYQAKYSNEEKCIIHNEMINLNSQEIHNKNHRA
ncbi:DUF2971 domain-containing protein [Plesiomonas shigelloides]|uniref:DUF2971 domain-containing protein n=1 Tax=Plesiomonas shigelloides TaxID=703 RepID=UPI001261D2A8|nr:DUF2971 domain-containing protein [Plesiomonas shigelloides]KAB7668789.1 DUF2971 domain-containing protein [Plesiomonas shigelloides]